MTAPPLIPIISESENATVTTESGLLSLAIELGASDVKGWSRAEQKLAKSSIPVSRKIVSLMREQIQSGLDPLGDLFTAIRTPEVRRDQGATYTPHSIVNAMLAWAEEQDTPARIVDPGTGSGRFLSQAANIFPKAQLVGVELDPLAAIVARANLSVSGFANRARIELGDYRSIDLCSNARTLFVGNPPYVRHHLISPKWKTWLVKQAERYELEVSQLAGLHVYFFLATVQNARAGDLGALITAAEWLDVNYGKVVRELFLGKLGGQGVVVVEPTARPFPDAATTAAITFFKISDKPASIRLRRVKRLKDLKDLSGGRAIRRERLETERRWSRLTFGTRECPEGFVELGELCRVHRGQVTGANRVWIAGEHTGGLPERVLFRSVTKARELVSAGKVLADASGLRSVVDLPKELDGFDIEEKKAIDRFLKIAKKVGADSGYVASHRRAWWSVGLRDPAPILATYMARRAPVFTRNLASARHINIAHGLYPREQLSEGQLVALVDHLSTGISVIDGRTYAGGLTKFEPGEMERLFVPGPQILSQRSQIQ
ncbi:N-6 DNA methylase [Nitrospira sp. CMX1]|nr:N-6 DNA methylase [Nitrospira sp.]